MQVKLLIFIITNNVNNYFTGAFNSSVLNKNILARFSRYSNGPQEILALPTDYESDSNSRSYFGPINIQKMRAQLLDEYGNILDLNNMDFSFSLEFICLVTN